MPSNRQTQRARAAAGDPAVPHGLNGYGNWGCRCKICRDANREAQAEYRSRPIDPDRHGTLTNYRRGCRCNDCQSARRVERDKRREQTNARIAQRNAETRTPARGLWRALGIRPQWSPEDRELAIRRDLTDVQVARLTGRTISAVKSLRTRLRRDETFPGPHARWASWTAEDLGLCARADLTDAQVARLTGRTVKAVQNRRRRIRAGQVG